VRRWGPCYHQVRVWQLLTTHAEDYVSSRLFVSTEYINQTQPDMEYLVRVFHVVQQQWPDYIIALPDVLSYMTSSSTSTSYIEPVPNASKIIDYPHLYEELVTFV